MMIFLVDSAKLSILGRLGLIGRGKFYDNSRIFWKFILHLLLYRMKLSSGNSKISALPINMSR